MLAYLCPIDWSSQLVQDKPFQDHCEIYEPRAGRLAAQHRDPFDRMIAAQALASDIPILSTDSRLDAFGIRRIWSD
jgi:PIN domain nuclease of toxin-antitoxin system